MSNNIQIDNKTLDKLRDKASEEAYIRACELVGPNSYEFDEVLEETTEHLRDTFIKNYYKANKQLKDTTSDS